MTDLLVITDVPRLRKLFTRLADDHHFRLRVTSSLEKGGEEIVADKPAMVFVQTHLSGLSADILLMHLKKQLGRRRSRFVLLSPPDQVSAEVLKLYQGHVDSSLADQPLSDAILAIVSKPPIAKKLAAAAVAGDNLPPAEVVPAVVEPPPAADLNGADQLLRDLSVPLPAAEPAGDLPEPTLVEQGLVYAPRPPLQVYSEFTSTFDTAVNSIADPEASDESRSSQPAAGIYAQAASDAPGRERSRPKLFSFLLWLVPVVLIVVVVTVLQYRSIQPDSVDVAAPRPAVPSVKPQAGGAAKETDKPSVAAVSPDRKPVAGPAPAEADPGMSDRAVLSAIAENRAATAPAPAAPPTSRLRGLPAFVPRSGFDKVYSAANPGWERYKGVVTEFKIFREGDSIKAIQVIDRGGRGVPDAFMKGVLQQVTRAPSYGIVSSEKKEGYEIQRGQVADNLKVVYYRDAEGGLLRAFVLTWQ